MQFLGGPQSRSNARNNPDVGDRTGSSFIRRQSSHAVCTLGIGPLVEEGGRTESQSVTPTVIVVVQCTVPYPVQYCTALYRTCFV